MIAIFIGRRPLRPPRVDDPAAAAVDLPHDRLTVKPPTLVIRRLDDMALPPVLLDGLGDYVEHLTIKTVAPPRTGSCMNSPR